MVGKSTDKPRRQRIMIEIISDIFLVNGGGLGDLWAPWV